MNNIEKKLKFWKELWNDLIDNFQKKSIGLFLYNPHILIDEIISEIEQNEFRNPDNRKYFYAKLTEYNEKDLIIIQKLKTEFSLLRKYFNSERKGYVLEISKQIKERFQSGLYFDNSLEIIKDLLLSEDGVTNDFVMKINYYSQGLIVELIKKSYCLKDIKELILNIFDNYKYIGNILLTNFPHGIDINDYKLNNLKYDQKKFEETVVNLINNITYEERILKLSHYYYKKKEQVIYIFAVEGLKGSIDIEIGGVNFYSLDKKKFMTEEFGINIEDLQEKYGNERFVQVAVKVEFLLPESSLSEAIIKIENALDILTCYFNIDTDLYLNKANYIVVDELGKNIQSSSGRDNSDLLLKYHNSLKMDEIKEQLLNLNKFSFLWKDYDKNEKSISKIVNALHWYRKGEDSLKQEDKMLNYWIAIENLFNLEKDVRFDVFNKSDKSKFNLIQETIASIKIFNFIYEYGWELYYYYHSILSSPFNPKIRFSNELIEKAQLKPKTKEKIYLKNFIDNLEEIMSYEENPFILEKGKNVIEFYTKSSITREVIENQINQIKNDLLMIYRFRNLIVHNAIFDNTLLPYFVWKIKDYAGTLIRKIISIYNDNNNLSEMIVQFQYEREKFISDFEYNQVNLFKN